MSIAITASQAGNVFRIPKSLVAPTRTELERLCLLNNIKHSFEFKYFDISLTSEGWVAWYLVIIDEKQFVNDTLIKKTKGGK